jgi:hypothetical protein
MIRIGAGGIPIRYREKMPKRRFTRASRREVDDWWPGSASRGVALADSGVDAPADPDAFTEATFLDTAVLVHAAGARRFGTTSRRPERNMSGHVSGEWRSPNRYY